MAALALALYAVAGETIGRRWTTPSSPDPSLPDPAATMAAPTDLAARLVVLEGEVSRLKRRQVVALLEGVLARQQPFETELASAIVMADRDQAMLADLDRLVPLAANGVPTQRDLLAALPRLIGEIRAAARQPGMIGSATVLMRDLALGLGVGELPEGSVEQLLRAVERAQQQGQLEAAAAKLRELPPGFARGVRPWLDSAAARETAEQALERLRRTVTRGALGDGTA